MLTTAAYIRHHESACFEAVGHCIYRMYNAPPGAAGVSRPLASSVVTAVINDGHLLPQLSPTLPAGARGPDLAQVFEGNCAACHAGGNNTVISDHTLRKAAMEQYLAGGFNLDAIVYQVLMISHLARVGCCSPAALQPGTSKTSSCSAIEN
jgi:hypothetical protein